MIEFRCNECGDLLEGYVACIKHNIDYEHYSFKLLGADIDINMSIG